MNDLAAVRRLDRLIWTVLAAVAALVLCAPLVSSFVICWQTFTAPIGASAILLALSAFYTHWRKDVRLASGLASTAQVILFAAVGAPLSYIAAAADFALFDGALDSMDRALGLDWRAMLAFMNRMPFLFELLRPIYLSLTFQMTVAVLCLAFSGRLLALRVYTLAFVLAALLTIGLSAVFPASGVWPFFAITPGDSPNVFPTVSTSWPVFFGLRDGSFRALVAVGSEGIISFPSLHAALAVILIATLWPIPLLRWFILSLNVAMLVATPIDGSHYFVDVSGGVAVAVLALGWAHAIARAAERRSIITSTELGKNVPLPAIE
jgi:hypothetical protein